MLIHDSRFITVVSGLPRSGTSMMMRMLEAGGVPILTDGIRQADEDNPFGYYEFEPVKHMDRDVSWLTDAYGRAVKMASVRLYQLPQQHPYRIVFMRRNLAEVLASQREMLRRRGLDVSAFDEAQLTQDYAEHLRAIEAWLGKWENVSVHYVDYHQALDDPEGVARSISTFLGSGLNVGEMTGVVDPSLHRQRR